MDRSKTKLRGWAKNYYIWGALLIIVILYIAIAIWCCTWFAALIGIVAVLVVVGAITLYIYLEEKDAQEQEREADKAAN